MNHGNLLLIAAILAAMPTMLTMAQTPTTTAPQKYRVYVGTYTSKTTGSKGIYQFDMHAGTGEMGPVRLTAEISSPSFLVAHPTQPWLYTAGELHEFQGKKSGAVSAFAIEPGTGKLKLLNQQPSGGQGPCHVTIAPGGRHVLAANYTTGTVASLPIEKDGRLGEPVSVIQHQGSGPVAKRQQGPHAHSINVDPAGKLVCAADLGADKIFLYRFGTDDGSLKPNTPPSVSVAAGAGPRHMAFTPNGRYAYVINEIGSTITGFACDAQAGTLKELQTISTRPDEFKGENWPADIHVHPSGKYLYGSNRGYDSIAMYSIDAATGRLTLIGLESTQGSWPRNFGIDPTGNWLLVANQKSDNLVLFRIDTSTGRIKSTGKTLQVPAPACVLFVRAK